MMAEPVKAVDQVPKSKFWEKTKKNPYVPLGILGTFAMIGYGVYDFKNRGNIPTSVYIMQYRVKAQSVVVGALTLGVGYHLIKDYFSEDHNHNHNHHDTNHGGHGAHHGGQGHDAHHGGQGHDAHPHHAGKGHDQHKTPEHK